MTKLTTSQLNEKCAELRKKYKHVVPNTLTNVQTKGKFKNKRTLKVVCPHCKKSEITSSQELFHIVCSHCSESMAKKAVK